MVKRRKTMQGNDGKYGKFIWASMVFCCLTLLGFKALAEDNCLQIRIWGEKNDYLPHEPILIKYEIYNRFNEAVVTNFDLFKQHFHISDNKGRDYRSIVLIDCVMGDTLPHGASVVDSEYIEFRYRTFNPGEYECFMEIPGIITTPHCLQSMKSNSIVFSVKEPIGEERLALDLYLKADSLGRITALDKKTRRKNEFEAYLDLADKYPRSIYAPISLYAALIMESVPDDKTVLISIGKKLIEDYPDSPFSAWAYQDLIIAYSKVEGITKAVEYMNHLLVKYPNSKISDRAEYWLGKIKAGDF
jgi:tetratricopeptide (TPR) repeat protein